MNSAFLVAISLLIFATAFSVSLDELVDEEFRAYKLTYKKNYKNVIEEMFRKKIFLENKLKIAQHNRKYLKGERTFAMALNQFSDLLHHEFVLRMNGLNRNYARNNRTGSSYISPNNLLLPDSIDWRLKGAVTPVKDQKECGSCWAFSSTGGLEGQEFRKTGKLVSLSEQNLVDCSTSQGNHGCAGGLMTNAFDYVKANDGIDSEESYPYNANDNQCKYNPVNKAAVDTGYVVLPEGDEKALQEAVAAVGPICVGIDASLESFMQYSHGIYFDDQCSSTFLDHGVLVVGYGTENGHDYWIVKNSWAEDWGEHGYLRMSRNRNNNCGIASGAVYPLV